MKTCAIAVVLLWIIASELRADEIKIKDGTVFKNATITASDPAFVTITHDDGVTRVEIPNLPEAIQKNYHYSEEKAEAHRAAEDKGRQIAAVRQQAERRQYEAKKSWDDIMMSGPKELREMGFVPISGKVSQTVKGKGLLISAGDQTVLLIRYPWGAVDDEQIHTCWAEPSDTFTYTTVMGAEKTVRAYRYIRLWAEK